MEEETPEEIRRKLLRIADRYIELDGLITEGSSITNFQLGVEKTDLKREWQELRRKLL